MTHQTTGQVAARLGTTRQSLIVMLNRHSYLKPSTRLPSGDFLWAESEIAALQAHKAGHKRGRPKSK